MLTSRANREIKYIVVHHSATTPGNDVEAAEIHAWHKERSWSGIGYNYVVGVAGNVESGRPEYWVGAHTKGHNSESIGVCIIGTGFPQAKGQLESAKELLRQLLNRYPNAKLVGHRDLNDNTECPGFDVSELGL